MIIVLVVAALMAIGIYVPVLTAQMGFWLAVVAVPSLILAPGLMDLAQPLNYDKWDRPGGEVVVMLVMGLSLVTIICRLLIVALPFHGFDWLVPAAISLTGGSVLVAAAWVLYGAVRDGGIRTIIPLLFFATVYAYGVIVGANALLDDKAPVMFRTPVIEKLKSTGKNTTYSLSVEPIGPFRWGTRYSVGYQAFEKVKVGDIACAYVYGGAFGWRHYVIRDCRR